jgi:hypothetical protein
VSGVEFDLAGERVELGDQEVEWLLTRALRAAGSSAAAGELATMLAELRGSGRRRRGPIALQRGERRALRALLAAADPPGPGLERLQLLLNGE